jgi:hypothetical protein
MGSCLKHAGMTKAILTGVMLMTAATVNHCRLVLGNPANGIVSAQGFYADFPASMWDKFESRAAIAGRHGEVKKENLMYLKDLDCIILRPDISLKQTMAAGDYTTDGGTWELTPVYGNPTLTMCHQQDVTAEGWEIRFSPFAQNQGVVFWWKKYATPSGSNPDMTFILGDYDEEVTDYNNYIKITLKPTEKCEIEYIDNTQSEAVNVKTEFQLPKNFFTSEFPVNILTLMIIDNNIVIGDSGLEWTFIWKMPKATYQNFEHLVLAGDAFYITGDGAILCGCKPLTYATSGGFSTKLYYPGYVMSSAPVIEKKVVTPTGTDITLSGYMGGSDISTEEITASDAEKFGLYFLAEFTGDGNSTPIYYKASVRKDQERISMSGTAQELDTQIIAFKQNMSLGKDGKWNGGDITTTVACEAAFYPQIFAAKSPQVQYYLKTIGQESEVLRDTHFVDVKEVSRPEHGQFLMDIVSRDITKELELTPMLESFDFDAQIKANSWKHVQLMQKLADFGGVTLVVTESDYATDPLLPYVTDADNAVWQFKRTENVWACMQKVQEYSGWMLYPNSGGELVYKPKPTSATTEDYTWDVNNMAIEQIRYKLIDLYRTRFLVWGKAAADNMGEYPYKKGENILGGGYHADLEAQLGRSRSLIILDPGLIDWDSVGRMVDALYDYYTKDPFYFSGMLTLPESYPSIWPGQVIKLSDSKMEWDGEAILNKKFMITSVSLDLSQFEGSGTIEAEVL